nr:hypothetical protein [Jannaschia seohaensis]
MADRRLTAGQLEFLDRIIDALSETGFVDPKNFYVSPYTDIDSQGNRGDLGASRLVFVSDAKILGRDRRDVPQNPVSGKRKLKLPRSNVDNSDSQMVRLIMCA